MSSKWRRYEVLLPLRFNDGSPIPDDWLGQAVVEFVDKFGAASYETQRVEGHWRNAGVTYRDDLARLIVDVPDTRANRNWTKAFKKRWKQRLQQLELWVISHPIEIE